MSDQEESLIIPELLDYPKIYTSISTDLSFKQDIVEKTIGLLQNGNTVPFVARYRKEVTGNLDETQIRKMQSHYEQIVNLEERKISVLKLIKDQDKLTESLRDQIIHAETLQKVEDFYLPYKKKLKTLGEKAKDKGLEPLAEIIKEGKSSGTLEKYATPYINEKLEVNSFEDALNGARDILAEEVGYNADLRDFVREVVFKRSNLGAAVKDEVQAGGVIKDSIGKEVDPLTFKDYFDFSIDATRIKPHQLMAINRAESLKVISVDISLPEDDIVHELKKKVLKNIKPSSNIFYELREDAVKKGFGRYMKRSIIREYRRELSGMAEEHAINVFAKNLKNLLMTRPLKNRSIIGIDPGFRTGSKVAVIDGYGNYLDDSVIYPHPPKNKTLEAEKIILDLAKKYQAFTFAIGNGTASRETEQFIVNLMEKNKKKEFPFEYAIVSEAGASVYSASEVAIEEFPDLDLTVRGAISIARRLQDPLSELIKIDPKSIGVGMYQHDVSQVDLKKELGFVIEYCVNSVGIDLNTASSVLLSHVSGLSKRMGIKIVNHRKENGPFQSRKEILDVSGLGAKTFEQCAGFLKIRDAKNPLDSTHVHPESYKLTLSLLKDVKLNTSDLIDHSKAEEVQKLLGNIKPRSMATQYKVSEDTIRYLYQQLLKPDLDPRDDLPAPVLRKDILSMEDLEVGMVLPGIIRNVVDFGAFVDIGVKINGLIHKSNIANKYVSNVHNYLSVGDVKDVEIIEIDLKRKRIQLSSKNVKKNKKA